MSPEASILVELLPFEPIFHTRAFGLTPEQREARTSPDYWEVGASGSIYSRDVILNIEPAHFVDAEIAGWSCREQAVRSLGPDTWLFTYTLLQPHRLTRRATIWQNTPNGWTILYHQGTIVPDPALGHS